MTDHGKSTDNLLDALLAKREHDESVLRTIELWKIAEPGMSLVLDDIAEKIRQTHE